MRRRSAARQRGDGGLGGRSGGDDEVQGGPGCSVYKYLRLPSTRPGSQQCSSIPSISAIFVAFSIMSEFCLIS